MAIMIKCLDCDCH